MKVEYLGHFGDDLMVVDAARVSFDKKSKWDNECSNNIEMWGKHYPKMFEKDIKLIQYLAKNNHWTPFAHPQIQVRMTVPIFIANQLKRSTVGFALNEVSRRYVDEEPQFYIPENWRGRPKGSIKQGSSETTITNVNPRMSYLQNDPLNPSFTYRDANGEAKIVITSDIKQLYIQTVRECQSLYEAMINSGVAPEMARMVLPQSMYTSWIWTGSLAAFVRVYKQRADAHAQKESQFVAEALGKILKQYFPVSFEALTTDWSKS